MEKKMPRALFIIAGDGQNAGFWRLLYGRDNCASGDEAWTKNSPITMHMVLLNDSVFRLVTLGAGRQSWQFPLYTV
jgi:hypothetical protein